VARDFMLTDGWVRSLKNRNAKIIALDGSHELPAINLEALETMRRASAV